MSTPLPQKRIAILGATGSIGTQALEVIAAHPGQYAVTVLTAHSNAELLVRQARSFRPAAVVIADPAQYPTVKAGLAGLPIRVLAGPEALVEVMDMPETDMVLAAMVGFAGLAPTIRAIECGKDIALANKETLVVAGEIIMRLAQERGVRILPVDSEHSAIFQCLPGEDGNALEKIILTASGGPFRGYGREQLRHVTKAQALKHPNWEMGAKITIDSASLANKGLEVIEARWLFDLRPDQIEVIVHPQSIVHSMVQFEDGSIKAQMGLPDMRLPIQYALSYPARLRSAFPRFDFARYPALTFEAVDTDAFENLALAYEALRMGGTAPCVFNAANEVANALFRADKIGFLDIAALNREALRSLPHAAHPTLPQLFAADAHARAWAEAAVQ